MTAVAPTHLHVRPDEERAVETIRLAFADDPVTRWVWPQARQYHAAMPAFTWAFAGRAFTHQSALCTPDYEGAALWLPPGVTSDDDAVMAVLERTVGEDIRVDLFGVFEQMATFHPAEPHWYLPLIGVEPTYQGQGFGSALLQDAVHRCDLEGIVAYLEATSTRNVPLYERHGFEAIGVIQQGSSPPLIAMRRDPA